LDRRPDPELQVVKYFVISDGTVDCIANRIYLNLTAGYTETRIVRRATSPHGAGNGFPHRYTRIVAARRLLVKPAARWPGYFVPSLARYQRFLFNMYAVGQRL
jgi:hypothetical protein